MSVSATVNSRNPNLTGLYLLTCLRASEFFRDLCFLRPTQSPSTQESGLSKKKPLLRQTK